MYDDLVILNGLPNGNVREAELSGFPGAQPQVTDRPPAKKFIPRAVRSVTEQRFSEGTLSFKTKPPDPA